MSDPEDQRQMIADCEARESRLNDYERGFIESLRERLERGLRLSRKQAELLDEVWERVTGQDITRGSVKPRH